MNKSKNKYIIKNKCRCKGYNTHCLCIYENCNQCKNCSNSLPKIYIEFINNNKEILKNNIN